MRQIRIGHLKKNKSNETNLIVDLWKRAGFNVNYYNDINQLIWEKFLRNVFLSAPFTDFECKIGDLLKSKKKLMIAKGCLMEAYKLGIKNKINFSFKNPISYGLKFARLMPNAKSTMFLDFLNKKKPKIDYINGAVVTLPKKKGLFAPYNETLTEIIKNKEKEFN
jgi:2-dehydropantoate 2-reductase